MTTTRVSWPATTKPPRRRFELVYSWEPPKRDPVDPVTGEPSVWERDHVRSFLSEALDTLQRLPVPPGALPEAPRSLWPITVQEVVEAYGYTEVKTINTPGSIEIRKMDKTLVWLGYLPRRRDPVIVSGFALGFGSRRIGKLIHRSHEYCLRRDRVCLELISEILNRKNIVDGLAQIR